jgi:hypothetical protein
VHLSLDGEFLGVVAKDMRLPAAVSIHGDYAVIAELNGQVTVLDKAGKAVAVFGTNTTADAVGNRMLEPAKWSPGIGRVHRFHLRPDGCALRAGEFLKSWLAVDF